MNQAIIRRAPAVEPVSVSPKLGTVRFIAGDDSVDRYRTVIDPVGMRTDGFTRNPVLLFEHGQDQNRGTLPIGLVEDIGVERIQGRARTMATARFDLEDEFARSVFRCYQRGVMRGFSVRIIPKVSSPPSREEMRVRPDLQDCQTVYRSSELAEVSAVAVPGNANALATEVARGFKVCRSLRESLESKEVAPPSWFATFVASGVKLRDLPPDKRLELGEWIASVGDEELLRDYTAVAIRT